MTRADAARRARHHRRGADGVTGMAGSPRRMVRGPQRPRRLVRLSVMAAPLPGAPRRRLTEARCWPASSVSAGCNPSSGSRRLARLGRRGGDRRRRPRRPAALRRRAQLRRRPQRARDPGRRRLLAAHRLAGVARRGVLRARPPPPLPGPARAPGGEAAGRTWTAADIRSALRREYLAVRAAIIVLAVVALVDGARAAVYRSPPRHGDASPGRASSRPSSRRSGWSRRR